MTYFDHNATAPLHPVARQAWLEAAEQFIANPSSPHRLGSRAETTLEGARVRLAEILECEAHQIVWTSGATEANNQVLHHFASTLPADVKIFLSPLEHPSIAKSAVHYFGNRIHCIPVNRDGVVNLDWLEENVALRRPGLVAGMAANNVTGVLQPWPQMAQICRRWGVPYFCDAVQWLGRESTLGLGACDFISGCAHKIGGPRGIGFLKCPAQSRVNPLVFGGPQEEGRRAGTENLAGAMALVAMFEHRRILTPEREHRRQMRDRFIQRLLVELPEVEIVGGTQPRLWNTVAALLPGIDCRQRWVVRLDRLGLAVSTGSACSSGKEEASPILTAMGYAPDEAGRVLRFSSGWETSEADWEQLLFAIKQAAEQFQQATSA
jgi:cysteine desulfurase